jgi:RNA polymerase sigma-32 factor
MAKKKIAKQNLPVVTDNIQIAEDTVALPEIIDTQDPKHVVIYSPEDLGNIAIPKRSMNSELQKYMESIAKIPILTSEQEKVLLTKAKEENDVSAQKTLVTANLRLVVKIALEYRKHYAHMFDLIQEGNAGLIQAVYRFDAAKGVRLSTYAMWWIRAFILKFIMENKSIVRIGTTDGQRKIFYKLRQEIMKLELDGSVVDTKTLAENLGVKETEIVEMKNFILKGDQSLSAPLSSGSSYSLEDTLADTAEENLPDVQYAKTHMKALVDKAITEFTHMLQLKKQTKELYILENRILASKPKTLQEIADNFSMTRERIRQIETKMYKELKTKMVQHGIQSSYI